jgi:hypothetical protein
MARKNIDIRAENARVPITMSKEFPSSLVTTFLLPGVLIALVGACAGVDDTGMDDDELDDADESTGGSSSGGSSIGGSSSGGSSIGGYTGSQPATLDTVGTVVQQACGGPACHNGETDLLMQKNGELYNTLMTYQSSHCELPLVRPGDPSGSALIKIVRAVANSAPCRKGASWTPTITPASPPTTSKRWNAGF